MLATNDYCEMDGIRLATVELRVLSGTGSSWSRLCSGCVDDVTIGAADNGMAVTARPLGRS